MKYVVFYNPLNNQQSTINILVEAESREEALVKARKSTRTKARLHVTEYKPFNK